MKTLTSPTVIVLSIIAFAGDLSAKDDVEEHAPDKIARPAPPEPVAAADLEAALGRGVDYLVQHQNKDGSWGSPALKGGVPIIAGIGSHHAYSVAVTAMSVSALIESGSSSAAVVQAIERGEKHLFEHLPNVRRDDPMLIYNVWTHAYGIQALVRMYERLPQDAPRRERIRELIKGQYEKLTKYESAEGGWGYYDFDAGTQRPAASSTSFVNAAVLIAFYEASRIGLAPPEKFLRRAIQMTKTQRLPDGSFMYGYYLHMTPTHPVNRPGGSLGRSQACGLALRIWGDREITDEVVETWLDRLITRNGWLSMGRKKPIPHESFFMVAGYFFYFGHYYAGLCIDQLPVDKQEFYKHHLARVILELQETDGSWFDYPFYDYHKAYGTAFAVMTLNACRARPSWRLAAAEKTPEPVAAAEKFAAHFFDRQFDMAVGLFDVTMTKVMPAEKLRDLLPTLEKQAGAYKARGSSRLEQIKQYQVVFIPCEFAKGTLEMKVVLDKDLRVTGLFFVPPRPAVEWKLPAYADKDKFEETPIEVVTKSPAGDGAAAREWRLPGFLTMPKGAGPYPGVVLVHGSGPNDADETIGPNKPFKDLAWGLASRGLAVVRYVKRTRQFGKELVDSYPKFTMWEETEEDAQSAIRLLRQTPRVDARRLFVVGHSLGGLVAPRIASRTPELAGIVIMAGNTRPFGVLLVDQLRYIFEIDGTVTAEEQKQLDEIIKDVAAAESPALKPTDKVKVLGSIVPGAYFLDLQTYNPVATAARLSQRILVLQGESDYQVTMVDFAGWQKGLTGKSSTQLKSYPKLNHLFMRVEGKSTPENTVVPGHVEETVVDQIALWIAEAKVEKE